MGSEADHLKAGVRQTELMQISLVRCIPAYYFPLFQQILIDGSVSIRQSDGRRSLRRTFKAARLAPTSIDY